MNCVYCCIFNKEEYIKLLFLLLESIFIYGELKDNIEILVYTSSEFMNLIKDSHLYDENKIKFQLNDNYTDVYSSCCSRLDFFEFENIDRYEKILYLDSDVLIKNDLNSVFDICEEQILYVLKEGTIEYIEPRCEDYWGHNLFTQEEINMYEDKSAFSSGIILFKNCEEIKNLFQIIKEDIKIRRHSFIDQPHIIYNAFKYNMYNNTLLQNFAHNNNLDINSPYTIHHFPGVPGKSDLKLKKMNKFMFQLKNKTIENNIQEAKNFINTHLIQIIKDSNELLEGNIFMFHHTMKYTDKFIKKTKNISNLVLNKNINHIMEIGFNAGFSTLLMLISNPNLHITCFDLGEHSYTIPCYEKIKEFYGDRLDLIIGDSTKTLPLHNDTYQLIHIDGGHTTEVATSDIENSLRLSTNKTILIMDDYDFPNLHKLWDSYIINKNLKKLDIFVYNSPHHDIKYII